MSKIESRVEYSSYRGRLSLLTLSLTRWVSAATGILSFLLFLPGIFRESYISEKELEALKKMAEKEESKAGDGGGGRSLVRRISRVVEQADHTGPTAGRTEDERRIKRRISRVAMQEVETERRNLERMQSTGEKLLSNLRKYSMTSPHDTNITMTDPSLGNTNSSNISPPTVSPLTQLYRGRC